MEKVAENPLQQDVYDANWHSAFAHQEFSGVEFHILMDSNPNALARVCNVLCVLNLVPQTASSEQLASDELSLTLKRGPAASGSVDLLLRKVSHFEKSN